MSNLAKESTTAVRLSRDSGCWLASAERPDKSSFALVDRRDKHILINVIQKYVKPGSHIITDIQHIARLSLYARIHTYHCQSTLLVWWLKAIYSISKYRTNHNTKTYPNPRIDPTRNPTTNLKLTLTITLKLAWTLKPTNHNPKIYVKPLTITYHTEVNLLIIISIDTSKGGSLHQSKQKYSGGVSNTSCPRLTHTKRQVWFPLCRTYILIVM